MNEEAAAQGRLALLDVYKRQLVVIERGSGKVLLTVENVGHPDGIQVDAAKGYFYWTDMGPHREGEDFFEPDGTIRRCRLDGTENTQLVGGGVIYTPKQLQLDHDAGMLYWCDREGGRVMRSRVDGSGLETLVERGSGGAYPRDKLDQCVGIALDPAHGKLYWTQKGPKKAGLGRIFRAGIDLPEGEQPWNRSDIELLADALPEPIDLEIDEERGLLYWTDRGAEPDGNSLNRARITAAGLEAHEILVRGFEETIGLALSPPENVAYVSDLSGRVYRIDLETLERTVLYDKGQAVTGLVLF
ncbi:MAG: hypothetical protein CMN60_04950 [Sphingobium sp.]|uniref:hypothetical protein n=1 Tax=Sphingomonas melonis TaxID=152682 RepID=UPI00037FCCD4|nr:hypothetical protein [Sphingomonas melonis]MBS47072.1 hypothetical protein [Sphingobium sp.]